MKCYPGKYNDIHERFVFQSNREPEKIDYDIILKKKGLI